MNVSTTEPFSAYGGLTNETVNSEDLVGKVMYMSQGELSDLVPTTNGVLLAFVTDRQAGDPAAMVMLKPQMQALADRYTVGVLFRDWEDYQLSKAGFEDYAPIKPDEEEKDTGSDTEEEEPEYPIEP